MSNEDDASKKRKADEITEVIDGGDAAKIQKDDAREAEVDNNVTKETTSKPTSSNIEETAGSGDGNMDNKMNPNPTEESKDEKSVEKEEGDKKEPKRVGGKKDIDPGDNHNEDKMKIQNDNDINSKINDKEGVTTQLEVTENDQDDKDKADDKKDSDDSILDVGKGKKMDENKATGVAAEAGGDEAKKPNTTSASYITSSAKKTNPYDELKWIIVKNDGKPESLIKLVALKSLFAKQLPKMPRTYIARLVFDRRHTSLAILSNQPELKDTDEEVIGSICYRAFPEMRFAEIAFCAVNASHQVKGYGTKLMNLLKREGARTGIEYFITYADNYAIGYFKKQGFTKNISMPKGRYLGLIKDYDGGTPMECYVHPSIDFTRIPEMLCAQRKFILDRIRQKANSTRVYEPLPKKFSPNLGGVSRANEAAARAMAIPGMIEAGWTMPDLLAATGQGKELDRAKNALKSELLQMIRKVEEQQFAWPFREPVDTNEVKDYLDVIKEPIDLSTIDKRIRKGDHYKSKQMLYADLMLMVNNCKLYNEETSTYVQCAVGLEKFLGTLFLTPTLK